MSTARKLVEAASALLDAGGEGAVTLRAVAQAVGVSYNAPYKHFKSRNALLAAVVADDFEMLSNAFQSIRLSPATPLAAELADSHDLAKKQAESVLGDLVTLATKHLKRGDKIRLTGLGILQVRKRAARMGRNPATGEAIKIKASKKIAFRPAKELKEAV
jgi:DNA-binding protein HU-beta